MTDVAERLAGYTDHQWVGFKPEDNIPGFRVTFQQLENACKALQDEGWAGVNSFDEIIASLIEADNVHTADEDDPTVHRDSEVREAIEALREYIKDSASPQWKRQKMLRILAILDRSSEAAPTDDQKRRDAITDDHRWMQGYAAGRMAERKAASEAAPVAKSKPALPREGCGDCDGTGWFEGGPTLQTECSTCDGTGWADGQP